MGISAFRNMKDSGLYFNDEITGRAAKVMSHPSTGEPMVYVGERTDFDFETKMARDNFEPTVFEATEMRAMARDVAGYFESGLLPEWAQQVPLELG
jgi:hypothetical protein